MLLEATIVELIMKLEQKLYQKYIWHNKNGTTIWYIAAWLIWKTSGLQSMHVKQISLVVLNLIGQEYDKWIS